MKMTLTLIAAIALMTVAGGQLQNELRQAVGKHIDETCAPTRQTQTNTATPTSQPTKSDSWPTAAASAWVNTAQVATAATDAPLFDNAKGNNIPATNPTNAKRDGFCGAKRIATSGHYKSHCPTTNATELWSGTQTAAPKDVEQIAKSTGHKCLSYPAVTRVRIDEADLTVS